MPQVSSCNAAGSCVSGNYATVAVSSVSLVLRIIRQSNRRLMAQRQSSRQVAFHARRFGQCSSSCVFRFWACLPARPISVLRRFVGAKLMKAG